MKDSLHTKISINTIKMANLHSIMELMFKLKTQISIMKQRGTRLAIRLLLGVLTPSKVLINLPPQDSVPSLLLNRICLLKMKQQGF
jgi:hypothetical protein